MITLVKEAYVLEDHKIQLHRKRQNLRKKEMHVSSYIEEFHRVSMNYYLVEPESAKLARYIQGLRLSIQDELSLCTPTIFQKCYQFPSKE